MQSSLQAANKKNAMAEPRTNATLQKPLTMVLSVYEGLTLRQIVNAQELVSKELLELAGIAGTSTLNK